jgi:hypothetical protein
MVVQLLQLLPHILLDILKSKKECGRDGRRPRAVLDSRSQILLAGLHQAAIGVIDDHKFLGVEQVVRHQQRAQTIVGHDAASVADDVRVPGRQPQCADGQPRVHTSKDGQLPRRPRSKPPQLVRPRVNLVRFQNFINHAHGRDSLAGALRGVHKKQIPRASVRTSVIQELGMTNFSERQASLLRRICVSANAAV